VKFLLLLLPIVLAGCVTSGPQFHSYDLDRNGVISRGEFTDAVAAISFRNYDRNHDGVIDPGEWRAVEGGGGNEALFHLRDLSRNGKISIPEARLAAEKNQGLSALFNSIDLNRDGYIDRAEARRYKPARR
jgi:Ca2+-binding EF-hand superfamily protein